MKQLVINRHLTSTTFSDSWSSVPCVADGAVDSTSMMVGPGGPGATSSVGGYNHQMLK